jgi:hypothetical protein
MTYFAGMIVHENPKLAPNNSIKIPLNIRDICFTYSYMLLFSLNG